ncbi:putative DNA-directed RNA polymerase [Helianthus annuus]|nr:putative DNA-directed RNA polymerase [Helianthus annuus]
MCFTHEGIFVNSKVAEALSCKSVVGHNINHGNTRCFVVERVDGTTEDFSYHKCIHHALKLIAPFEATVYESRWLNGKE